MNKQRLEILPILLEKYESKLSVDVENGLIITELKPYLNHKGYLTYSLWKDNKSNYFRVHELIAYVGGLDLLDKTVDHINGVKLDNRIENLRTVTALENHKLAKEQGLFLTGEKNHMSVLSDEDRINIKSRYTGKRGEIAEFAREYGVVYETIYYLIKGRKNK